MNDRIAKTIELKAPVSRVWRALTDHVEFGTWFRAKLDGPFAVGKATRARSTYAGYEHIQWEMVVTRMEPERVFSFTSRVYGIDPKEACANDPPTVVTFTLEATATGTRLNLVESGFGQFHEPRRSDAWRDNDGGWDIQMANITRHVESAP